MGPSKANEMLYMGREMSAHVSEYYWHTHYKNKNKYRSEIVVNDIYV